MNSLHSVLQDNSHNSEKTCSHLNIVLGVGIIIVTTGIFYYLKSRSSKNFLEDQLTLSLIDKLQEAKKTQKIIIIYLHWNDGCAASKLLNRNQQFNEIRKDNSFIILDIPWQIDSSVSKLPNVQNAYNLLQVMIWNQKQSLTRVSLKSLREGKEMDPKNPNKECNLPIETFSSKDPVFPQILILDGKKLNALALSKLKSLYSEGALFEKRSLRTFTKSSCSNEEESLRLQFQSGALKWIDQVLQDQAVIVQLLNENLFQESTSNFQHKEFSKLINFIKKFHSSTNAHTRWTFPVYNRNSI